MAALALCILLTAITFANSHTESMGRCGFPGQPWNGSVQVAWNASSLSQQNWEASLSAFYSCDKDHALLAYPTERKCSEGKWTGRIPQCAEIKRITTIRNNGNLLPLQPSCQWLNPYTTISLSIERNRRLHGILLTSREDYWVNFQVAQWTFHGWKQGSSWQVLKVVWRVIQEETKSLLLAFDAKTDSVTTVQMFANIGVLVCGVELWAYHDECGHPEVPVHGSVQWTPDDTTATYRCDDGYQLNSTSATRHCHQGTWNGSEPTCEPQQDEDPSASSWTYGNSLTIGIAVIGFCCILLIALLVWHKKRTWCQIRKRKNRTTQQSPEMFAPAELAEKICNEIECEQLSENDAERVRQNRQSRREWMEQQFQIYAELDSMQDSDGIKPQEAIYQNDQIPVYAQIDKSKKSKRNQQEK